MGELDTAVSLTEYIIGEEEVTDGAAFAERMVAEAERMWQSDGWKVESDKDGLLIESKAVNGVFAPANLLVTRSSGVIAASVQATFDMLVSPAGYAVIDPVSEAEDHERPPLETYFWREGTRLEAAIATAKMPLAKMREFVVLNAIDPATRIFASKSILHAGMPGGSKYSSVPSPRNGRVRALNTFAIKTKPIDDNQCEVLCVNYADMAGSFPSWFMNFFNTKLFLAPLYKRIAEAMQTHR